MAGGLSRPAIHNRIGRREVVHRFLRSAPGDTIFALHSARMLTTEAGLVISGSIDSGLFAMSRRSDEQMTRALFAEHGRAMQLYAMRLLGDRELAEDVVQEALIRIWRHPEVLTNGQGSVRGWLRTTVRNIVISWARARAVRPREIPESPTNPAAVDDHAAAVVASVAVHAALDTLTPEHRAVIEQLYLHGRDMEEVARILDVPKGTVKSRAYYALRALRRAMQPDDVWERQAQ
jgi:RNA polymerase sigma-70 factor, ECF subfamily